MAILKRKFPGKVICKFARDTKYNASLFRIKADAKIGSGNAEAWFDIAKRTDKLTRDIDHNFTYLWLMYKIPVYSSDPRSCFNYSPLETYDRKS